MRTVVEEEGDKKMNPILLAFIGTMITFLATVIGSAFVFFFRNGISPFYQRICLGFAAGVMIAASVWSLLIPAIEMAEEQGKIGWIPAAGGFIFAVVLAATYLTTRWMGGMQRGRQNNKNLHVIETISVGNNKMISIVEAGSVYLVVSVGKEEVHLLAQLKRDQLKDFSFELEQSGKKQDSFAEILNQLKDKLPKKQG